MPPRFAIGPEEEKAIHEVVAYYRERGADFGYQGHFEERYCDSFTKAQGGGYADSVATGTLAIFVALAALDMDEGGEVLVSPITDPGSLSAIILNRLVPRLVDSVPGSYNIGVDQVLERATPRTKALLIVHAAGRPVADTVAIVEACRSRGIHVIEDCSQAHGARLDGTPVGNFGDIAAFSTMYRKAHITGASGGAVYTRNEELYHLALAHADRGKPRWRDDFDDLDPNTFLFPALNLHTDEISCAIGIASLARLPQVIERRLNYVSGVTEGLEKAGGACRPYGYEPGDSPFFYPIIVDTDRISVSKIDFAEAILAEGIGLNPRYQYLVADWSWVKPHLSDGFDCPNARDIIGRSFNLYVNENYGGQEVTDTLKAIEKVDQALGCGSS